MEKMRNAQKLLVRKHEDKLPLGRSRQGQENDFKIHLKEIGCDDVNWTDLAQDRAQWWALVNAVVNFLIYKWWIIS
jgi:hypothetical protein